MDPLEYLRALWIRWPIVAAAVGIAVLAALISAPEPQPDAGPRAESFTATHTLLRTTSSTEGVSLETMALLATRDEIPDRVADQLPWADDPDVLAGKVTVSANPSQGLLEFTAADPDPGRAVSVADTFAEETVAYFAEQAEADRLETIDRLREQMASQRERAEELDAQLRALLPDDADEADEPIEAQIVRSQRDAIIRQYGLNQDRLEQLEGRVVSLDLRTIADATAVPVRDDSTFEPPQSRGGRVLLAVVVALLLGGGLVLAIDRLDTRLRTRRAAEDAFGLPVVAEIPRMHQRDRHTRTPAVTENPTDDVAEAYRVLRLSLQLMPRWTLPNPMPHLDDVAAGGSPPPSTIETVSRPARVILVTSPGGGQGKTVTVANLAASYAEAGKTVCVLDCDLRAPELHLHLGTSDRPGVTDLIGDPDATIVSHAQPTIVPGVWLVPGGTRVTSPGLVLGPDQDLVRRAVTGPADVVLIDSGPLLAVTDPAALVPHIDAVVVVARHGRTTVEAAQRTRDLLARLQAPVLGVVLTAMPRRLVSYQSSRGPTRPRPMMQVPEEQTATEDVREANR